MMVLDFCNNGDILTIMSYVRMALTIIRIVVPLVLIISLMVDYARAVKEGDTDALAKTNRLAVKKGIAVILIFLIPTFVNFVANVSYIDSKLYLSCITKATKENISIAYRNEAEKRLDTARNTLARGDYLIAKSVVNKIKDEATKKKLLDELAEIEGYIKLREEIYELAKNFSTEKYNDLQKRINAVKDKDVKDKLNEELKTVISNMGTTFSYDVNPSDPMYNGLKPIKDPVILKNLLAQKGSSVEKLNLQIKTAAATAGNGTRQAPVAAGLTLINTLAEYGYYVTYKWGGKWYNIGVRDDWGKIGGTISCNTYPGGEEACQQTQKYSGLDCSGFVNWAIIQGFGNKSYPTQSTRIHTGDINLRGQTSAICDVGDVLVSGGHIVMVVGLDDAKKKYIIMESGGGHGGVGLAYKAYNDGGYYCRKLKYSN